MERITLPGTLDSLADIRRVVGAEAQRVGLSKKATYNLLLGLDEIATNIVMHGYEKSGTTGPFDLTMQQTAGQFVVTLADDAPPFDPLQHVLPNEEFLSRPLEERPIGGMGIYLTINGVDEFKYEYTDGRNHNIFVVNTTAPTP